MLSDHDDTYGVMPGSSNFPAHPLATDERLRRALERDKARRAEAASASKPNCSDRLHDPAPLILGVMLEELLDKTLSWILGLVGTLPGPSPVWQCARPRVAVGVLPGCAGNPWGL
jgi:hypothetical protein